VLLLESAMRDLFNNPEHYQKSRSIIHQRDGTPNIYSNTWLLPEAVQMTPEVEREIVMMSNLEMVTPSLLANQDLVDV